MSWKSIAGNQTISRANLQNAIDTGVFIEKNGVPAGESNRQITKANAQDYVYTWDLYSPFLSKASNQLPIKSNLAVQSNQIYAIGSDSLYVGNNNRGWEYSILSVGGDDWGSVASATNSRCILAGRSYSAQAAGGGVWVSNDYGETFTRLDSVMTTSDACLGTAMNSYGDYMILTRQVGSFDADRAKIYQSSNAGLTWTAAYNAGGTRYNFNGAAMSGVGVYATVLGSDGTNYYVFTSNSYGSSFTRTYLCQGTKTLITGCVGMSKSGQYQLLAPPEPTGSSLGYFYVSNNYGNSWTPIYINAPGAGNDIFKGCSVSAGGDYMTVVGYSLTIGEIRTCISSDFGVSWTVIVGGSLAQAVDTSGQFQYQKGRASIDYGNTWGAAITANAISVNSTTLTIPYIYGTSTGGNLYKSVNQGVSFSALSLSGYFTKVATSGGINNGKYVAAIKDNDPGGFPNYNLYQSNDFGVTWSTILSFNGQVLQCCAVSDDGFVWFAVAYEDYPNNTSYLYKSTNSGTTWDYIGLIGARAQDCAMSNTGQYITITFTEPNGGSYDSFIANSSDYGVSFSGSFFTSINQGKFYPISISGRGRFRTVVRSDPASIFLNALSRVFYSSDYGVNWNEKFLIEDFYPTSCAMDDSGRVGLVSFAGGAIPLATTSRIFSTKDGWNTYDTFQPTVPVPLAPPIISGVNVSSDATYWSAVSSNAGGYSFTCTTGDGNFVPNITAITFNGLSK